MVKHRNHNSVIRLDKIFSDHPALLNLRGACYVEIRAFDKASPIFEKILTITPESINVRFNLAEIDFVAKRWESAHKRFEDLLTRVPATNNISEREIRPSVVFRKVTNGFRSDWGAGVHAGYRSLTSTARLHAHTAIDAVRALVSGKGISGMDGFLPTT